MYELMQTIKILIPLYIKKHTSNNSFILNYKSEYPYRDKIVLIKNLLNRAKYLFIQ